MVAGIYALAYGHSARRGWIFATAAATLIWAVIAAALRALPLAAAPLTIVAWIVLAVVARLMPAERPHTVAADASAWDLPVRMAVSTALVLGITSAAPLLGPFTSGLLTAFPLYGTVLAVFAQREAGPSAGIAVMRGLIAGAFAFAAFFLVIATTLPTLGIPTAFVLATLAVVAVQSVALVLLRRTA
jgi:hypothetical protein